MMSKIGSIDFQIPGKDEITRYEKIHNICFKSAEVGSKMVANEIAQSIRNCSKSKFVLGLATGSSPIGVYRELVRLHKDEGLSFKNVISFNLDEYFPISRANDQSYFSFMHHHLFSHIDILKSNINIPEGKLSEDNILDYCDEYEKKIDSLGGIDFQLLGIGRTAHIGFNEPGSNQNSCTRIVSLDPITKQDAAVDFNGIESVPNRAITMGIRTILGSKRIVLLAWGHKKSEVVSKTIEGQVDSNYPASFLQNHNNTTFILDKESSAELTKHKTPWLVKEFLWSDELTKKAIVWLSRKTKKSILKLTQRDYNENGLSSLIIANGSVYDLNIWMFNQLQKTITGWPGGKPDTDDTDRPERAFPAKKRVLVFSPHPDDDMISMGGTIKRLHDQGHDVHIAYQTSGNIGVSNEEAQKFIEIAKYSSSDKIIIIDTLHQKIEDGLSSKELLKLKASIRRSECLAAARYLKIPQENLHFMNLPFYESGKIKKNEPSKKDNEITVELIKSIRPHQIFAAGDLADPHGTHRVCLNIILDSLHSLKKQSFMKSCWLWLYRGAWQEWDIDEIEMAVPMSPSQVVQKRNAILYHQSQKDKVMFQGEDNRDFWLRAEQRNKNTAKEYNHLGMAEYEAMEAFKRYIF